MKIHYLPSHDGGAVCSVIWLHDLVDLSRAESVKELLEEKLIYTGKSRALILVYKHSQRHLNWVLWGLRFKLWGIRTKKLFSTDNGVCYLVKR